MKSLVLVLALSALASADDAAFTLIPLDGTPVVATGTCANGVCALVPASPGHSATIVRHHTVVRGRVFTRQPVRRGLRGLRGFRPLRCAFGRCG